MTEAYLQPDSHSEYIQISLELKVLRRLLLQNVCLCFSQWSTTSRREKKPLKNWDEFKPARSLSAERVTILLLDLIYEKETIQQRPASSYHHTTTHGHTSCSPNELHISLGRRQTDIGYFFLLLLSLHRMKKATCFPERSHKTISYC